MTDDKVIDAALLRVASLIDELVQAGGDDIAVTWSRNGYRVEVRVITEP